MPRRASTHLVGFTPGEPHSPNCFLMDDEAALWFRMMRNLTRGSRERGTGTVGRRGECVTERRVI